MQVDIYTFLICKIVGRCILNVLDHQTERTVIDQVFLLKSSRIVLSGKIQASNVFTKTPDK